MRRGRPRPRTRVMFHVEHFVGTQMYVQQLYVQRYVDYMHNGTWTYWFSREAAQECSPRRQPWVRLRQRPSPEGAIETVSVLLKMLTIHPKIASKPLVLSNYD